MKSLISASSTFWTTPSPIDAALPVICAAVWILPPAVRERERHVGVRVALPAGLARLDLEDGAVGVGVLLDHGDGALERHRHRAHLDLDLGLDAVRARSPRSRCRPRRTRPASRGRGSSPSCARSACRSSTSGPVQPLVVSWVRVADMSQNFGPDNGSLKIRTARTGGAAKAGHDLVIEVESWQATLDPEGAARAHAHRRLALAARARRHRRPQVAERRRQGRHQEDDRQGSAEGLRDRVPLERGAATAGRPERARRARP